jgi:hypothetical protein
MIEFTPNDVPQAVLLKPALYVQVIPSGDVAILALPPPTQNCVPVHVSASVLVVPQAVLLNPD